MVHSTILGNKTRSSASGFHSHTHVLEEESNIELFKALKEVRKYIANLKLENVILERFLVVNDPKLLAALNEPQTVRKTPRIRFHAESASKEAIVTDKSYSQLLGVTSSLRKVGSYTQRVKKDTKKRNAEQSVNYKMKIELAEHLCRELRKTCDSIEVRAKISITRLKGEITELKMRNNEVIRTGDSFRNYISTLTSSLISKVSSEKYIHFIEEWIKAGMVLLNKLRTRYVSIKQQSRQQNYELNKKAKLRKSIREIDYDYLRVQKEKCERAIEKTRQDLIIVKLSSEQTVERLCKKTKQVFKVDANYKSLVHKLKTNQDSIAKMQNRTDLVIKEIMKYKTELNNIEHLLNTYIAPKIGDYLVVKDSVSRLTRECKKKKLL